MSRHGDSWRADQGRRESPLQPLRSVSVAEQHELDDTSTDSDSSGTDGSVFSTPRAQLAADVFSSKADRFLRQGMAEAAARECCRGLAEVRSDERLEQVFHDALRRVSSSVPSIDDCSAIISIDFDSPEHIIGDPLQITVNVRYRFDPERLPFDGWLGLYAEPDTLRALLNANEKADAGAGADSPGRGTVTDQDLRSAPELGLIARVPMPQKLSARLVFPAEPEQQPAPPGGYEVRYYVRGNAMPLALSDTLRSRWPEVDVQSSEASVTCGTPIFFRFTIDSPHESLAHEIHLCPLPPEEEHSGSRTQALGSLDVIDVSPGKRSGEVCFNGSHIVPGRYVAAYRLSPDFGGRTLKRSLPVLVRVSALPSAQAMAARVFRIYLAANPGVEMEAERQVLILIHTCMHTYMHTYINTYMRACMHAYMHACMHAGARAQQSTH